jgi:protocatechuate 3,4-dioxygenase beta subunit
MVRLLIVSAVMCCFATTAGAQTATVSGTVLDESGAGVPGATV